MTSNVMGSRGQTSRTSLATSDASSCMKSPRSYRRPRKAFLLRRARTGTPSSCRATDADPMPLKKSKCRTSGQDEQVGVDVEVGPDAVCGLLFCG